MIKKVAKEVLRRFGCEIRGPATSFSGAKSLKALLDQEQINLVLDVGANAGQFGSELRSLGYKGRIISFEPLSRAHVELSKRAEGDSAWTVFERSAIGAIGGSVEIHVAGNSTSSSILEMLPTHCEAAPNSKYADIEIVPVKRLDDLEVLSPSDRVLLKIDVQGYERQVLDGAANVTAQCRAILTEMSLVPLYEGQALARELWDLIGRHGFEPWSLEPGFRSPGTYRLLQVDGLFIRSTGR